MRVNIAKIAKRLLRSALEGRSWFRPLHSRYVGWRARNGGHPDWSRIAARAEDGSSGKEGQVKRPAQRILIATSIGGHLPSATMEGMLGLALKVRGAEVEFLLCDSSLPACMTCESRWYRDLERFQNEGPSKDHCPHCYDPAQQALSDLNLVVHRYSSFIDEKSRKKARELSELTPIEEIENYKIRTVAIGEHARAGALRFFARGTLEKSKAAEGILRRYFEASLLTHAAIETLLEAGSYDCVVLHHGIYAPQGIIAETTLSKGGRVVTWHPAYRTGCFIFSHGGAYHKTLMDEPTSAWENMSWSPSQEKQILDYLKSRWIGNRDWQVFQNASIFERSEIEHQMGVDLNKPCIGLLTNVFWDAQLHYDSNAFKDMREWVLGTVRYFQSRPDLQLLIRIHPAEISGTVPSQQKMVDELRVEFPELPQNVFIIPPESEISTYAVMEACSAVTIFGTKTGVELASQGIPVIVAGEAWIRGKGVTIDVNSEEEYYQRLDELPFRKKMPPEQIRRARKYAYHFFFRRMIPLEFMKPQKGWPPFQVDIEQDTDLMEGASPGLDVICDGILENTPFIFLEEEVFLEEAC